MTTKENKEIIRRFIEDYGNKGITDGLEDIVSPEYTEVHEGIRYNKGIEGAKEHITGVRQVYPDLHISIDRQIAEGDWVATCITVTGTHTGTWMGIKPTGKKVTYTGVNVDKVVNSKIVEHGGAANLLIQLLEIGAIIVKE